jgi:hypothetical protein
VNYSFPGESRCLSQSTDILSHRFPAADMSYMTEAIFKRSLGRSPVKTTESLWHATSGRVVTLDLAAVLRVWADPDGWCFYGTLFGYFDAAEWDVAKDGLMYTDQAVESAVNDYLVELGLARGAIWSEQGAQSAGFVDFEMTNALSAQLFPNVSVQ